MFTSSTAEICALGEVKSTAGNFLQYIELSGNSFDKCIVTDEYFAPNCRSAGMWKKISAKLKNT